MTARLDDWDALGTAWRDVTVEPSTSADLAALRGRVRNRRHLMIALVVFELALTVACVAFALRSLLAERSRASVVAAAAILAMTVIVWGFTIWNRRGSWAPMSETTVEYLRLSRRRINAGKRTLVFVRVWLAVFVAGYGPWFVVRYTSGVVAPNEWTRWIAAAAYGVVLSGWTVWYARRLRGELARVEAIERALGVDDTT